MSDGYLLLEDGTRLDGEVGGPAGGGAGLGEVVFNTSMSGYQEAVTDPSYAGQIIVFTYPLVGNYGVARDHMESDRIHARAVIMREGIDREDAAHAEGGWLTWLSGLRRALDHRRGHARARAPHPRPRRDARRRVRRGHAGGRGHGARPGRAADDRARPGPRGHARPSR